MNINVEIIPHDCQRYDTVGDWTFEADGTLNVNVSRITALERAPVDVEELFGQHQTHYRLIPDVEQTDSEFLIAIHEIIEAYLCKKASVTQEQVDRWDMNWANWRTSTYGENWPREPGEDPQAPYHVQHLIAQSIEMMLCAQLGLSWKEHCEKVDAVK
jgi:hypothetical protein